MAKVMRKTTAARLVFLILWIVGNTKNSWSRISHFLLNAEWEKRYVQSCMNGVFRFLCYRIRPINEENERMVHTHTDMRPY